GARQRPLRPGAWRTLPSLRWYGRYAHTGRARAIECATADRGALAVATALVRSRVGTVDVVRTERIARRRRCAAGFVDAVEEYLRCVQLGQVVSRCRRIWIGCQAVGDSENNAEPDLHRGHQSEKPSALRATNPIDHLGQTSIVGSAERDALRVVPGPVPGEHMQGPLRRTGVVTHQGSFLVSSMRSMSATTRRAFATTSSEPANRFPSSVLPDR